MIKLNEVKLAVALPTYDGRICIGTALSLMAIQHRVAAVNFMASSGSLLAHVFNGPLCAALDLRDKGELTHLLMLHADIIPQTECWLDILWHEYTEIGQKGMLSVVQPIKDQRGLTSTAVEGAHEWSPRRLTMHEVMEEPITFTRPDIMLNTGMLLFDLREDWVDKAGGFTIRDALGTVAAVDDKPARRMALVMSEDWGFSRQARAAGCPQQYATRAVPCVHVGGMQYPNNRAWGEHKTDQGG